LEYPLPDGNREQACGRPFHRQQGKIGNTSKLRENLDRVAEQGNLGERSQTQGKSAKKPASREIPETFETQGNSRFLSELGEVSPQRQGILRTLGGQVTATGPPRNDRFMRFG
jgi:hypothetical protein